MMLNRDLVLGTAGHIDHGKTALVKALTGVDTDRLPAEKLRGISIEVGFAALKIGAERISVVDVPGHERFVRNMVAGATGIDVALLVIAADDGVMPQTREHLEILKLLGVRKGVVVLTKCDKADAEWRALVRQDITTLVAGSFLSNAEIVETIAPNGIGIEELKHEISKLICEWQGDDDPGAFRLAIDRVFTRRGHGTIVTGTVLSGVARVGAALEAQPMGTLLRIRGIHRHGEPVDQVSRGTRAALNLVGNAVSELRRGHELAEPGYLKVTRRLAVALTCSPDENEGMKHRDRVRLHIGTAEIGATLTLLDRNRLSPGDAAFGLLSLEEPVVAVSGQPFIVRRESPAKTLGGGRVLEPTARKARRRDPTVPVRLSGLASHDPNDRLEAAVDSLGLGEASELDLCRAAGVPLPQVHDRVASLLAERRLVELDVGHGRSIRVTTRMFEHLRERVLKTTLTLHQKNPRLTTIQQAQLASSLPDLQESQVLGPLISGLAKDRKLNVETRRVALASFRPSLSHAERKFKEEMVVKIESAGFSPPEISEFLGAGSPGKKVAGELLELSVEEGRLVPIGPGLYLGAAWEREMCDRARTFLAANSGMTMADLRDILTTTRKYAVPFGEYLDRVGLTIRDGDYRRLRPTGEGESADG